MARQREVEVDSPGYCMGAMSEWWHTGTQGDDFHEACERLSSPDPKVRAQAAEDATKLLASAGVSWSGIVGLVAYCCDDGRNLPPY